MFGRPMFGNALATRASKGRASLAAQTCVILALALVPRPVRADEPPAGQPPPADTAESERPAEVPAAGKDAANGQPAQAPASGDTPPARTPTAADIEEAKKYWTAGRQAFDVGRFDVAAKAWERAYALTSSPKLAFSMAHAYRRQYTVDQDPNNLERAIALYREYLRRVPQGRRRKHAVDYIDQLEVIRRELHAARAAGAPTPAQQPPRTQLMVISRVAGARAAIGDRKPLPVPAVREVPPGIHQIRVEAKGYFTEQLAGKAVEGELAVVQVNPRPKPGKLTLRAPAGARVTVDGKAVDRKAVARGLEMPAGRYWVTVRQRGRQPWSRGLELDRGQQVVANADLESTRRRVGSYYAFGTTGILAAAATVTALIARDAQAQAEAIERRVGNQPLTPGDLADYNLQLDRRNNWRAAAYVCLGSAVAAGLTGAFLFFFDDPEVHTPQQGGWRVTPTTSGAGLTATWTTEL